MVRDRAGSFVCFFMPDQTIVSNKKKKREGRASADGPVVTRRPSRAAITHELAAYSVRAARATAA